MKSNYFLSILCLISCGISFFCAGQVPPSGGPPDLSPPVVLETLPHAGETYFNGQSFTLTFNKYVDRTSFQQSFFLSPPLGKLTFDWSGKEVEVHFSDRLRDSTTYVLTLGTDFHDTRNNRLPSAYTLAFSTGGVIDSAVATGRVVGAKTEGVMIFAYRLDGLRPDTLNLSHRLPDYLTQTGTNGTFALSNLAMGRYRVIAVRDQFKNLLYDVQTDEYGVTQSDISLNKTSHRVPNVNFKLAKEDTASPFLSSARAFDCRHISVHFSEPMRLEGLTSENFLITDTSTDSRLEPMDFSFQPGVLTEGTLVVSPEESLHVYRLLVRGAKDLAGNMLSGNPGNGIVTASAIPDTLKPQVGFEDLADSTQNILWNDTLKISFTKAIDRRSFDGGCTLLDAGGIPVRRELRWLGSSFVRIFPSSPLSFGMWYALRVVLDSVKDYAANRTKDSVRVIHFRVIDEKLLGSLKGMIIDDHAGASGKIHISTHEISSKTVPSQEIVVDSAGAFEFPHLQEGKYVLSAYRDADGNGEYSYGKVFPFVPSERFVAESDTLKVRARWPVEGVVLRFE